MNTERAQITVSGIPVEIVRKDIKNLHLGVYPPHGRVRVAAPLRVTDEAVRLAVVGKLAWIKRHRNGFETQPRQSAREMVSGETHFFLGRRYRLRVVFDLGASEVKLGGKATIAVRVPPGTSEAKRNAVLLAWYRRQLKQRAAPLIEQWQKELGVQVSDWRVKKMKTRWGTCNAEARRIWLNLELAKKPVECIEYIIAHELVHLIERHHDDRFIAIMDKHMPQWRARRKLLNAAPLSHEAWVY